MRNKLFMLTFALIFSMTALAQSGDASVVSAERKITVEQIDAPNKIELYPNPSVDFLVVHIKNSTLEKTEFEIHSIIGNEITIEPENLGNGKYRIPVKDFASGYYFVVVKDETTRFKEAFKFLKK